jgi:hypothetical protein
LTEVLGGEYDSKDDYQKLPDHYLEVSLLLLECSTGCSDIPDAEEVRRLIQSLREVRHQKTLDGLKLIDGDPLKVRTASLCACITFLSPMGSFHSVTFLW